jgi:hypothetical protein
VSETNAERLRRLRAEAVAKGLCYTCRCRPVRPGTRYCESCYANVKKNQTAAYTKRKRDGLCPTCGGAKDRGKIRCADCNEAERRLARARNDARYAAGICAYCENPRAFDRRSCDACLAAAKARTSAWRDRMMATKGLAWLQRRWQIGNRKQHRRRKLGLPPGSLRRKIMAA